MVINELAWGMLATEQHTSAEALIRSRGREPEYDRSADGSIPGAPPDRQTDRQTVSQTDRQTGRQAGRQTDRQTQYFADPIRVVRLCLGVGFFASNSKNNYLCSTGVGSYV